MGQIANRESLVFSEHGQVSQAIPQIHVERIPHNERQSRDSNRSATNVGSMRTKFCVFRGIYDCQRTLVIRISVVTLASDSATTLARFRPPKDVSFFHLKNAVTTFLQDSLSYTPPLVGLPEVLWKKAPRAMRAMRGNALETMPFQPYFGCTESFLKVLSNKYFQATRAMRAKLAVTAPSATVL